MVQNAFAIAPYRYGLRVAHVYIAAVTHGSRDLIGMENKPWEVS